MSSLCNRDSHIWRGRSNMRVILMAFCLMIYGCTQSAKPAENDRVERAEFEAEKQKISDLEDKTEAMEQKIEELEANQGDTAEDENLPARVAAIEAEQTNHGW